MDLTCFSDNNFELIFECVRLGNKSKISAKNEQKMQVFFQNDKKVSGELFHRIEHACEGLIYISETDAPVLAFAASPVEAVTADVILQQAGLPSDSPVEERDFGEYFGRLTAIRDWYGEAETTRARKFLELQKLLEEFLRELKVFRVGAIRLDIFAVGIDKDGRLMGVTTKAVET